LKRKVGAAFSFSSATSAAAPAVPALQPDPLLAAQLAQPQKQKEQPSAGSRFNVFGSPPSSAFTFSGSSSAANTPFTFSKKPEGAGSIPLFATHQPYLQTPLTLNDLQPIPSSSSQTRPNPFSSFSAAPPPSSQRAPSPSKKAYDDIVHFFSQKGDAPLTSDEAARIQNLLKLHVDGIFFFFCYIADSVSEILTVIF
jgi:hypothetical protein